MRGEGRCENCRHFCGFRVGQLVARDAEMYALHERYPQYGFAQHKGYGTAAHLAALAQFGALPEHRADFAPVKLVLAQGRLFG